MQLVAVVLAGGGREAVIRGALDSVASSVDRFVLIDTGASAAEAIGVAISAYGDRCSVFKLPVEFDCATARNFGLDCAAEIGADWALSLDTDERIRGNVSWVRRFLSETETNVVLLNDANLAYNKVKFIRLPRTGAWAGVVHEQYATSGPGILPSWLTFEELPKSQKDERARALWIVGKCREAISVEPSSSRWHFYLGDALCSLGDSDKSVTEFLLASRLACSPDDADWCHYRAGQVRCSQGRYADALAICFSSSLRTPELLWLSALCTCKLDDGRNGLVLATRAAEVADLQRGRERTGFSDRYTWFEGPYQLMAQIYEATGDRSLQLEASRRAKCLREARSRAMTVC